MPVPGFTLLLPVPVEDGRVYVLPVPLGRVVALGGDLSAISGNPAGIGVFRKSEINFTPLINFSHTKSNGRESERNSFQLANMGFVVSINRANSDWRGFNFAFNYTNLNNFNRILDQTIWDSENSLLDVYAWAAYETPTANLDNFSTGIAYDTYLLDSVRPGPEYAPVLHVGDLVDQYKYIKEKGNQGEYAFTFGTNYKDIVYLGATLGLQSIYYKLTSTYSEYAHASASGLNQFHKPEFLKISGSGVNFKFGAIYRPIPEVRIGLAIHTPTWYNIDYRFSTYMNSRFDDTNPDNGRVYTEYQSNEYLDKREVDMKTPWRAIVSVASVLAQRAIISVDYEYVDYAYGEYNNANDYADFHYINNTISDLYQGTHNLRIGAEYRVNSVFSLRGGYSFMESPYKDKGYSFVNSIPGGDKLETISGGIGLNFGQVYFDAAFTHMYGKDKTVFYYVDQDLSAQTIKNKYTNNQARISVGIRF
ncbi:outer membrane protein transport protein [Porphyromonadaceae bacterium OttesenSCG-928-L07]|nr:outer membrane protein transport protein [Porphyromonadaceae bacterium OttesenSCG-928-L07]